jgi:hypothetical protein
MIIVYRKGDIRQQIAAWGADRERAPEGKTYQLVYWMPAFSTHRFAELEAILLMTGALDVSESSLLAHAEKREREENLSDDDLDDLEEDDYPTSKSKFATTGTVNARTQKNIRGSTRKGGDSDSDFEFDI